jgi:hypothetical protein
MSAGACGNKAGTQPADEQIVIAIGFPTKNGSVAPEKVSGTDPKIETHFKEQFHVTECTE